MIVVGRWLASTWVAIGGAPTSATHDRAMTDTTASDALTFARAQRERATDELVAALSAAIVEKLTANEAPSSIVVGVYALGDDRQTMVEEVHAHDSITTVSWITQMVLAPASRYEVDKLERLSDDPEMGEMVAELVSLRSGASVEGDDGQECFGYRLVDGCFEPVDLTNDGLHRLRWDSAIRTPERRSA